MLHLWIHHQTVYEYFCKQEYRKRQRKITPLIKREGMENFAQVVKERENVKLRDHLLKRWIPHHQLRLPRSSS